MSLLSVIPQGSIGGLLIDATFSETLTDTTEITENPVQVGAQMTDHSFDRQDEVSFECGWSNANTFSEGNLAAALGLVSPALASAVALGNTAFNLLTSSTPSAAAPLADGSTVSGADYVSGVYSQLLALKQARQPLQVTTTIRSYPSMLVSSLVLTRDQQTSQALMVRATLRQVILVSTQVTTLPPAASQANPQNTQPVEAVGAVNPVQGTPTPGGAVDPSEWQVQNTSIPELN